MSIKINNKTINDSKNLRSNSDIVINTRQNNSINNKENSMLEKIKHKNIHNINNNEKVKNNSNSITNKVQCDNTKTKAKNMLVKTNYENINNNRNITCHANTVIKQAHSNNINLTEDNMLETVNNKKVTNINNKKNVTKNISAVINKEHWNSIEDKKQNLLREFNNKKSNNNKNVQINPNIVIDNQHSDNIKINNGNMQIKYKNNVSKTSDSNKFLIKHSNNQKTINVNKSGKNSDNNTINDNLIRLNKAMSMLGVCSRRDADKYIYNKSVYINGVLVDNLGAKINNGDIITVNGINYTFTNKQKTRVWIYNKPSGLVTTHKDEKHRETVFDNISETIGQRVISVGRLDLNSEGLLLLTNDGSFARYAESPSTGWERHYRVRFFGNINDNIIKQISNGITIDGIKYSSIKIINASDKKGLNKWCTCILKEGKNREIRKIFNHFGLQVNKLIRTKYGPYELGNLKTGEVMEVNDRRRI
ncbi:MAG: rRNA pseudouridine synthase [Alphaproteobacteria bacterium]|nr:rRNA pseudouridine synthase [Alphaproteobacteria bacterium]